MGRAKRPDINHDVLLAEACCGGGKYILFFAGTDFRPYLDVGKEEYSRFMRAVERDRKG
jgi:hypothetical protein